METSKQKISRRRLFYLLNMFLANAFIAKPVSAVDKHIFSNRKYKIMSGYRDIQGFDNFGLFRFDGKKVFSVKLNWRSHDSEFVNKKKEIVVFPRRPGKKIIIIDAKEGILKNEITSKKGYHYYGHGTYSDSRKYLYASENNYTYTDSKSGIIGIYDTENNYKRIGEFSSYGIGPHEIKMSSDESNIIVANGGILTHPNFPRIKLNLDSMDPNISIINANSGKLIQQYKLSKGLNKNSIRHLDVSSSGEIIIACQYNGNILEEVPLLVKINKENKVKFLHFPKELAKKSKNYCGGIKILNNSDMLMASFPRGGILAYWNLSDGKFIGLKNNKDVCGIDVINNLSLFVISNGKGEIFVKQTNKYKKLFNKNIQWDNHLKVIKV